MFNSRGICKLSSAALSTTDSIKEGKPVIKSNAELIETLHLESKSAIVKLMTLQKIKNVYRIENDNRSHDSKSITNGLPEFYMGIIKGSKKFKKNLLKTKKFKVKPWTTMNKKYLLKMEEIITLRKYSHSGENLICLLSFKTSVSYMLITVIIITFN